MKLAAWCLTIGLCLSAVIGDYIVFKSTISSKCLVFRAISDSLVHGYLGFLSAVLFFRYNFVSSDEAVIYNLLLCTFVSTAIDIDHVFVAKSFFLKDLTSLKQRGIFHCSTFWIVLLLLLISYSYVFKKINVYMLSFMIMLAISSHHIRDANRRGLWVYPFGHTAPIPNKWYILLVMLIPNLLAYSYNHTKHVFCRNTVISDSLIV